MILKILKRFFKRNKGKKGKSSCRKRKFAASVGLACVLLCGRPSVASAKSSNQDHNNQLADERVVNRLNMVEDNLQSDSFERLETVDHSNQLETISKLRGGELTEEIIQIIQLILIWHMSNKLKPTEGFQPPVRRHSPGPPRIRNRNYPGAADQPVNPMGLGNIPRGPSFKNYAKLDNKNPGGNGNSPSMEKMCRTLSKEYRDYQRDFNSPLLWKRFDTTKFSKEKFMELAQDPKANKLVFLKTTVDEARAAIQLEMKGIIKNVSRIDKPYCKSVDLDFKIDGPGPYTYLDVKHPVGSQILKKQGQTIDIQTMAYRMGENCIDQKTRFCGLEQGPKSPENVLHVVDLGYVPLYEKEIVKEYCLKGAQDAGTSEGILFIYDK